MARPLTQIPPPTHSAAAEKRAEALLQRHLTLTQRRTLKRWGWFRVDGKDGSIWTIHRTRLPVNVLRVAADGKVIERFCTQLPDAPVADTLLVQKLCIEATGGRGLPVTRDDGTIRDEDLFISAR